MKETANTLECLCELDRKITYGVVKPGHEDDEGVRLIRGGDVLQGRISEDALRTISPQLSEQYKRTILRGGELLISLVGNPGEVAVVPERLSGANIARQVGLVPLGAQVNPSFVMYFLRSPLGRAQLFIRTQGAVQQVINLADLKTIEVPDVSLATQRRITSILSAYDDLIENNRRRIQLLEQSARLLYKEWFVHLRFPGHEHVNIKNGVPEGWRDTFLVDVIDVNPKTFIENGKEVWYVPMSALSASGMTADVSKFERRTKHTTVKFKKNDVLLARITPCLENGKTGLVHFLRDDEIACGSTEFIVLRGKRVSHTFAYCLARSYPFRGNAIKSMIGSSGRQRVQVSCFDEYKVPLPPKHLLEMFDEIANENFEQVRVLIAQNVRLERARDLLLPRLMNGDLVV